MTFQVCQPLPNNATEVKVSGEPTRCSTLRDQIAPLLEKLGKFHCLVNSHIHLQQVAGSSMVSYNSIATVSWPNLMGWQNIVDPAHIRNFLAPDHREIKKAMLHLKAHKRQLSSVSRSKKISGSI